MKSAVALLLLAVIYYVESKWDSAQKGEHRKHFHSTELLDRLPDPLETNKIPVEKSERRCNSREFKKDYSKKKYFEGKADNGQRHSEVGRLGDQQYWEKKHYKYYEKEKYNIPRINVDQNPPNHTELIPMARYVMHNADWVSISTISTLPAIKGFPFTNIKSMVDGYINNSTGIPYFYMSPLDFTTRDLKVNKRATILASLEETNFCDSKEYDPQDPRCTRVMLTGKVKPVKNTTSEYEFARGALFQRHPAMASYPLDHDFFVTKMKIAQIVMVDWFGGAKYIPVRDYLAFNYTELNLSKH